MPRVGLEAAEGRLIATSKNCGTRFRSDGVVDDPQDDPSWLFDERR